MAALPASRALLDNTLLELVILVLGVIVGSISFFTSFKKHRKSGPMILGILGILFLVTNLLIIRWTSEHSHFIGQNFKLYQLEIDPLMIFGGIFLIAGHMWNIRECHCFCGTDCEHSHPGHEHKHSHHH